jgi:DNA-3-methyladenine glycosylase II
MTQTTTQVTVAGPWSLATSKQFWESFAPTALTASSADAPLQTTFCVEGDWQRAEATVSQHASIAHIAVRGDGDLDAATAQVCRFLSLDVDARSWPQIGTRDPIIGDAQARLPGLRPCGFHSPYEAAAWAVLSQRIRIVQAAALRKRLIDRYGEGGAFPPPAAVRRLDLDLPGRKTEYLHAVADAALDGALDGATLRAMDPIDAVEAVRQVKGLGPFAAELVVVRGANAPDALPRNERRLEAEVAERYGSSASLEAVADTWRPFRSWAAVHLRVLREERTHEISGPG